MPNSDTFQPQDLILTQDGSVTIYSRKFNDHYHSTFGAIRESQHIFIDQGFKYLADKKKKIHILEVGLGAGLNVFMTFLNAQGVEVEYTALEPFGLEEDMINQMNYPDKLGNAEIFDAIHQCEWGQFIQISKNFNLRKLSLKMEDYMEDVKFDLVYFDAFSPAKQPELWEENIFRKIYKMCGKDAVLMTYSSKGAVKRALSHAGFVVNKIPGPLGKREIIRAIKEN